MPPAMIDMDEQEAHLRVTKTAMLTGTSVAAKRAEIKEYFNKTYDVFEKLYSVLKTEEAFQMRPLHKLRHPHIFYFGHTAVFFINKLAQGNFTTRINPLYEEMFAIGVDEMQWDDLSSAHYDFPSSAETQKYRDEVRERVNTYIDECPLVLPITWESGMWPVLMGIEHERIHLETSTVLIRELPLSLVRETKFWRPCAVRGWVRGGEEAAEAKEGLNQLVPVRGGRVTVGRGPQDPVQAGGDAETGRNRDSNKVYGWDADYGKEVREVADFEASQCLVSNAEFMEFMKAGGYSEDRFWTDDGRRWRNFREAKAPHFWVKGQEEEEEWRLRTMAEEIPLPMAWPAEVNQHEAKAFCAWKSEVLGRAVRLPTEAEWSLLFDDFVGKDQWEWEAAPGNINLERFTSSCPVDMFAFAGAGANSGATLFDVVGNVWQHTETPTGPLEGFRVHPLYDDFSMPTFDGDHTIQKGGCWIATGNEATRDARFAFRRHFYQMIGIRYVVGEAVDEYSGFYKADPVVDRYTEMHYGDSKKGSEGNFCVELAKHALAVAQRAGQGVKLAADIGCRSGRTSFELTRGGAEEVQGIDMSARYIMPGCQMRECQQTKWEVTVEGDIAEKRQVQAAALGIDELIARTTFWQSDPCNLHAHLRGYDLVVVNLNLLERLSDPAKLLRDIGTRMTSRSVLVVASTFAWDAEVVPRELWLGGRAGEGSGVDAVRAVLDAEFAFLEEETTSLPYAVPLTTTAATAGTCKVHAWRKRE